MGVSAAVLAVLLLSAAAVASAGHHDYGDALHKSILFFEGQRSGRLPPDQRLRWRRDSGLRDGAAAGVDLTGGYYDAGDNVKFGFPMAFTATLMSWGLIDFGRTFGPHKEEARKAVRWATDYFMKATAKPNTVYVQVGDAFKDHSCWERPEDMDTPRTVYKVDPSHPGSDVAAETAAALAAGSIVFREADPVYSQRLLDRAMAVFKFADRYRGAYSSSHDRKDLRQRSFNPPSCTAEQDRSVSLPPSSLLQTTGSSSVAARTLASTALLPSSPYKRAGPFYGPLFPPGPTVRSDETASYGDMSESANDKIVLVVMVS